MDHTNVMAVFHANDNSLTLHPAIPESSVAFEATFLSSDAFRFYLMHGKGSKSIQGYKVDTGGAKVRDIMSFINQETYKASLSWEFTAPKDHVIAAFSSDHGGIQ